MDSYLMIAAVMVVVGVSFLAAEFFLPTGGVLVVVGIACMAGGVGVVLYSGSLIEGVVAIIALCIGLPIAFTVLISGYKRMSLARSLDPDAVDTVAETPEIAELATLKGQYGKTLTVMRPAGAVAFDGRRVDAVSEGMMIDAGMSVKCVDVRAGRVVVRAAAIVGPTDLPLTDFS